MAQRQSSIDCDQTIGIARRSALPARTQALAENQIAALWRLDVARRKKTFWKMLYESAPRALRRSAVPKRGRPLPTGQTREDRYHGGHGVD